ncbi:T-complex 11 [Basidiobolus meristosporus CBS 931.73]|uniref:T-complex 11 n=1 Tax=Basidiobolus meristosporus CBS 931.73 TaxID=1314790 RepID=A0A1Y1ZBC3_9FUNG|nr:T-complex 11 [Basidiobolus meristosporus CBS 931.73]|eukprot:ORY07085.1 T-complex 11 [Basidiobolus meristosporus CBS 931.73]
MLTNEQLAHEILLNPDFELTMSKGTNLEERVREVAIQDFFETIREEFNQGKYEFWFPQLVADIKNWLLELVSRWSPMYELLTDVIDIELISQQLKSGTYDIPKLMKFITESMLDICAPVRDQAIRNIQKMTDLASVFQCLVEILQDMKLDLANYQVNMLHPLIQEYGIAYEKEKFNLALSNRTITLERTTKWLCECAYDLRSPTHGGQVSNIRFDIVYYKAILSTIFSMTVIHHENCPETLTLDVERLYEYQNESQAITIVAALLMLSKNIVPEFRKNPVEVEKLRDRLFVLLKDPGTILENLTVQLIDSLSQVSSSKNLTRENQELIRSMVDKTLSSKDPVYMLLSRRISKILLQHLSTGHFPLSGELVGHGIEDVSSQLQVLSRKLVILANHNREVYAAHYNKIIHECIREGH